MTREEAIKIIHKMLACTDLTVRANLNADMVSACNLAIKALEQEPTTKNNLGVDAVSRQAVLDLIADYDLSMGQVVRGIHALPPVTPQEPRWIPVNKQLPKIHNYSEAYLATLSNGEVTEVMFTETNGKSWWERTRYKIIAWMPLPQPYREVKE